MYFSITHIDDNLYNQAKDFFIKQWRSDLLYKKQNSLIWAYLISEYMHKIWKIWFFFQNWIYSYEDLYFSTSHSQDYIAIAIDNKKIAIDIEFIKPRNSILLNDISITDESLWLRENFYLQRCAKECLIKYLNLTSDDMKDININNIIFYPKMINNNTFNYTINTIYKNQQFNIISSINNNYIITILQ